MWRTLAPVVLIAALASCDAGIDADNQASGGGPVANATLMKFNLASDFQDGQPIPSVHSCDGADRSPALNWDEPPPGTKSFALVMDDPDAPSGTFHHWGAYDIPPTARSVPAGHAMGKQSINSFGRSGYSGPCPPQGHGPHRYQFKLYALDVENLNLAPDAIVEQLERQARQHQIGVAQLTGTFERN
ncbi:MAG TPA: YbhB/YbcL family Raf kinase inhibitor-like protein [Sphingomicrobium sp.]|nr:YbhB/YbcL family Raf kinase inhibitor-like protein [Sphingomicrobium sp.]